VAKKSLRDRIILIGGGGQGSSGFGFIGDILLIAGVAAGGYYLYDSYTKCKWPFDGSIPGLGCGSGGCAEGQTKCVDGVSHICASNEWVEGGDACTVAQIECPYCTCTPTFATQAALDQHIRMCHSSGVFYEDWQSIEVAHLKGATEVELWFCQPMLVRTITGYVDQYDHVRAGCNNDTQVDGKVLDGGWVVVVPRHNTGLSGPISSTPGVVLEALKFRSAIGGGFLSCGVPENGRFEFDHIQGITRINITLDAQTYHSGTTPVDTRVCQNRVVGWYVNPSLWKV